MIIETERLVLRQWKECDREEFFSLNADPVVMEFFPKTLSREESDQFIDKTKDLIDSQGFGFFATELKSTGEFIGFIGLNKPTFEASFMPCVEIGWRLKKEFWRKGYASEGAKACLTFAFDVLKLDEVVSFTSVLNLPSIGVMEKIGMKRDTSENFLHPRVEDGHRLKEHVLYRKRKSLFH